MAINSQQFGAQQYENVDATGDWTITINNGDYSCGSSIQQIDLSNSAITVGRWVLIRVLKSAGDITGWVGATITPPSGLTPYSVTLEDVDYGITAYKCVVVTLV